jgi:4a-hydroxytetrahydrobiopterin dehydratase
MATPLSDADRAAALALLPAWTYDPEAKSLHREFRFKTFAEAFGFITRVALLAEKADHHPDWSNSYNRVSVTLSTHSAGGVTGKDVDLATAMDRIAG